MQKEEENGEEKGKGYKCRKRKRGKEERKESGEKRKRKEESKEKASRRDEERKGEGREKEKGRGYSYSERKGGKEALWNIKRKGKKRVRRRQRDEEGTGEEKWKRKGKRLGEEKHCCESKYIEFVTRSGSRILVQFGSGSRLLGLELSTFIYIRVPSRPSVCMLHFFPKSSQCAAFCVYIRSLTSLFTPCCC